MMKHGAKPRWARKQPRDGTRVSSVKLPTRATRSGRRSPGWSRSWRQRRWNSTDPDWTVSSCSGRSARHALAPEECAHVSETVELHSFSRQNADSEFVLDSDNETEVGDRVPPRCCAL